LTIFEGALVEEKTGIQKMKSEERQAGDRIGNDKRNILKHSKRQAVTTKGALLTQVLKVDEQAKTALINLDLVLADEDGLVSHEGLTLSLIFHDGDWQSESEALHSEFSKLLEERLSSTSLFGAPVLAALLAMSEPRDLRF
jgi:hypothetical protein